MIEKNKFQETLRNSRKYRTIYISSILNRNCKVLESPIRIWEKEYRSYSNLVTVFCTCIVLHILKDYLVSLGCIFDKQLNLKVLIQSNIDTKNNVIYKRKSFTDNSLVLRQELFTLYITKDILLDDKFMKYFEPVLNYFDKVKVVDQEYMERFQYPEINSTFEYEIWSEETKRYYNRKVELIKTENINE